MIPSTALPPDGESASPTTDFGAHGPECYDQMGALACAWPERHDIAFTEAFPYAPDPPAVKARPMASILDHLLTALIVALGAAAVGIGVLVFVANLHFQTVTSGSMRPTFSPGDMAVTEGVPVGSLKVGDVIVFFPPGHTQAVIHRIVSLENGVIKTRGDANSVEDPWQVTLAGTRAYRMVAVVPFIGWLSQLQGPAFIVAGLLVGLAILIELWKEVRGRRTPARSGRQPDLQTQS